MNNINYLDISVTTSRSEKEQDYPNSSRKSKMISAFQITKNVYLPTVGSSLKHFTSEASSSIKRYYNSASSSGNNNPDLDFQTIGNGVNAGQLLQNYDNDLADLTITTYDAYTHYNSSKKLYVTEIRGNVCLFNQLSRKNKWVYMGLKKLIIGSNKEEINLEQDLELLDRISTQKQYQELESTMDAQPNSLERPLSKKNTTIFDSRIYPFLNKGVSSFPLVLKLNDIGLEHCLTKANGDFEFILETKDDLSLNAEGNKLSIMTNLRPHSVIMTSSPSDSEVMDSFKDFTIDLDIIHYSDSNKIGVISDIDDTIKFTGVVESKKVILDNTFNKPIESWLLPPMANWYKFLKYKHDVDFFYVSNSPQQLYTSLRQYIDKYYPNGVIVLKEYLQSNIFANFLGSSATKKLERILKVIDQYKYKKFLLIGDSGESDLEAYLQICMLRPENIIGVYIRAVKGSISDDVTKEEKVVFELNRLIDFKYNNQNLEMKNPSLMSSATAINIDSDSFISAKGESHHTNDPKIRSKVLPPPPPPPRNSGYTVKTSTPERISHANPYNYNMSQSLEELAIMDRKKDNWEHRVNESILNLKAIYRNTNNRISFKFFQDDLIEESCKLIENVKNNV